MYVIEVRVIDGFQSRDETAMLVHKTIANHGSSVLHYNTVTVKFLKDFFLYCYVHQQERP